MARKKPGSKAKTRKKTVKKKKAARPARSAKAAKARKKKPARTKAPAAGRARTKKKASARTKKKSKKTVKKNTGVKSKSKAASKKAPSAKASAAASKSKSTKKAASEKPAKLTKAQAKAAKAEAAKKGSKKAAPTGPVPDAQGYVVINGRRVRMISTKGLTIPKKATTSRAAAASNNDEEKPKKPRKSRLTPKDLEYFRELLLLRRRQLAGDLTSMETEALRSSGGSVSHMPIHMADIGSDTFDQDFMLGLAANERGLLKEIDDALMRIETGEYGVCALTGNPIPKSRLNAKPWAKYTVEAARMIERGLSA